jgi:S-adenosyl methyltransferase
MHSDPSMQGRPIGTPGWWAEPSLPPAVAGWPDWSLSLGEPPSPGARFDPSVPHPARVYDYWLGGKDHFPADRQVGERVIRERPQVVAGARANRAFLARVVRYLAAERGIGQFLDIGTGLPSADNTHQVAQHIAPGARVVYVDNDPLVLVHARALLTSTRQGACDYLEADLRDPGAILDDPVTREVLDFTQPIALMLIAILHMIPDEEKPAEIVATLLDALPSGSYIVASHITAEHSAGAAAGEQRFRQAGLSAQWRDGDVFARLAFNGLDLVPPGVVLTSEWRNDEPGPRPTAADVSAYGGVARKP